jgi:hypothetical protein
MRCQPRRQRHVLSPAVMVTLVPIISRLIMPPWLGPVPMARWRRVIGPVIVIVVHGHDQRGSIGRPRCRVINRRPCEGGANSASASEQTQSERGGNEKAAHLVLHRVSIDAGWDGDKAS